MKKHAPRINFKKHLTHEKITRRAHLHCKQGETVAPIELIIIEKEQDDKGAPGCVCHIPYAAGSLLCMWRLFRLDLH